jgi:hypothetical protein
MAIENKNIAADNFWLNIAAENIYASFEKRKKSVEDLNKVILWAFGVFTAGGFGLIFFKNLKDLNVISLWCFGFAYFFLVFAYLISNSAQYPIATNYNPLSVLEIQNTFEKAVIEQAKRFTLASILTFVGFGFLAFAILNAFISSKFEAVKIVALPGLSLKTDIVFIGDSAFVPLAVNTKKNSQVTISILYGVDRAKLLFSRPFLTDSSGKLSYTYPLIGDTIEEINVEASILQFESTQNQLKLTARASLSAKNKRTKSKKVIPQ